MGERLEPTGSALNKDVPKLALLRVISHESTSLILQENLPSVLQYAQSPNFDFGSPADTQRQVKSMPPRAPGDVGADAEFLDPGIPLSVHFHDPDLDPPVVAVGDRR